MHIHLQYSKFQLLVNEIGQLSTKMGDAEGNVFHIEHWVTGSGLQTLYHPFFPDGIAINIEMFIVNKDSYNQIFLSIQLYSLHSSEVPQPTIPGISDIFPSGSYRREKGKSNERI
jgi:hypothetical protein